MAYTQTDGSNQVGSGTTIRCEQGAMLTPVAGAITVTDSFHTVDGGTLSTITGGVANSLYVLKANSTVTISGTTNINTSRSTLPTGDCFGLWFDGTTYQDLASIINGTTGTGSVVLASSPNLYLATASGWLVLDNAAPLLSKDGAGTGYVQLVFADASDYVHMCDGGATGLYIQAPNSSIGSAGQPVEHVILYVGAGQNAAPGASDLTSANGAGVLVGMACYPVFGLTAHDTDHYGAKFWVRSLDDGVARTLDTQTAVIILPGEKGTNTIVTTMIGLQVEEPLSGATNIGIKNLGTSWLAKNVGIGAAPSATYPLWTHLATNSNFGVIDSTGATGGAGALLASMNDSSTLQPIYFNGSTFVFFGLVQIGTASAPSSLVFAPKSVTLANGANTVSDGGAGFVRITGPTGSFSVNGFDAGSDGQIKRVFNAVAQQMTITNEATATANKQITTLTGADVVLRAGKSFANFIYDGTTSKWILTGTN